MMEHLFNMGVLVRRGTEFGANGRKHFRNSYATSMENLQVGMDRLKRALEELK